MVSLNRPGLTLLKLLLPLIIITVVLGGGAFLGAYLHYQKMKTALPAIDATGKFIMLVGSGNLNAAQGMTTDAIDLNRLTDTAEQISSLGVIREVNKYFGGQVHSRNEVEVQALLEFTTTQRLFVGQWVRVEDRWLLKDYQLTDAPTTQPDKQPEQE
jgi:hypothetical protein